MEDSKILDWNVLNALGMFPEKGEEIIWAGRPNLRAHFHGNLWGEHASDRFKFWVGYYTFLILVIKHGVETRQIWPFLLVLGFILATQGIPFALDYFKINRTFYVVTNTRIVLRFWRFFAEKNHILRYDDFQRTSVVIEDPSRSDGTIYLMTGKDVGFWTYELASGERRQHPTLERVDNAEILAKKIEKIRLEKISLKI